MSVTSHDDANDCTQMHIVVQLYGIQNLTTAVHWCGLAASTVSFNTPFGVV